MIRMVWRRIVIFSCLLAALLACPYAAAAANGILAGTVTDLDGNGIPGASVSLYRGQNLVVVAKNPQTTISSPSVGPVGHYGFKDLTPGRYRIVVEKSLGASGKYTVEQQVTVASGTVIQDIVLVLPTPSPTPAPYFAHGDTPPASGFGLVLAAIALAGAIFLVRRRA